MAKWKWDHDDLMSKHNEIIKRYYDDWALDSMAPSTKKRAPLRIKTAYLPAPDEPDDISNNDLEEMLSSRMRWGAKECPFDEVLVRKTGEVAHVITITDKDLVVIKDEINLFPSDALVTQLRLLGGK